VNLNEFDKWHAKSFVTFELLDFIGHIIDSSSEDVSRSGIAIEDLNNNDIDGDLSFRTSTILDMNKVSQSADAFALNNLVELKQELTMSWFVVRHSLWSAIGDMLEVSDDPRQDYVMSTSGLSHGL